MWGHWCLHRLKYADCDSVSFELLVKKKKWDYNAPERVVCWLKYELLYSNDLLVEHVSVKPCVQCTELWADQDEGRGYLSSLDQPGEVVHHAERKTEEEKKDMQVNVAVNTQRKSEGSTKCMWRLIRHRALFGHVDLRTPERFGH